MSYHKCCQSLVLTFSNNGLLLIYSLLPTLEIYILKRVEQQGGGEGLERIMNDL